MLAFGSLSIAKNLHSLYLFRCIGEVGILGVFFADISESSMEVEILNECFYLKTLRSCIRDMPRLYSKSNENRHFVEWKSAYLLVLINYSAGEHIIILKDWYD